MRTCRTPSCKARYAPTRPLQTACSTSCAIQQGKAKAAKKALQAVKERKADTRKRKEKLKTKSEWMKEAQISVNLYVRTRDKGKPCISSGVMEKDRFTGGYFDAGHYRSRGAAGHLRFNTWNIHSQAKRDNRELSGNIVEYRKGLIERIGIDRVERLEADNAPRTFNIEYLKRIKRIFNKRAKHIARLRDNT